MTPETSEAPNEFVAPEKVREVLAHNGVSEDIIVQVMENLGETSQVNRRNVAEAMPYKMDKKTEYINRIFEK